MERKTDRVEHNDGAQVRSESWLDADGWKYRVGIFGTDIRNEEGIRVFLFSAELGYQDVLRVKEGFRVGFEHGSEHGKEMKSYEVRKAIGI